MHSYKHDSTPNIWSRLDRCATILRKKTRTAWNLSVAVDIVCWTRDCSFWMPRRSHNGMYRLQQSAMICRRIFKESLQHFFSGRIEVALLAARTIAVYQDGPQLQYTCPLTQRHNQSGRQIEGRLIHWHPPYTDRLQFENSFLYRQLIKRPTEWGWQL